MSAYDALSAEKIGPLTKLSSAPTETFTSIASNKMEAAGNLIVAMVAHGVDHTVPWPYVTLSSFQQRSTAVRALSGVLYLGFSPMVRTTPS